MNKMNTILNNQNNYPENNTVNNNTSMFFSKIVTHDLNNLLTMIFGNISLAKLCINEKDKVIDLLGRVEKTCEHAQYLIHNIVESSDDDISRKKIIKLDRIINFITKLCINDPNIKLELNVSDDLWSIKADEVQIIQVLMNLLLNSIQAMPNGGIIKIEAENIILGDSGNRLKKGKYIRLSIYDNGIGIPEENISKIFDINFTTKKEGKGLGLYIIKDIISKHQGYISVMSKLGTGTNFKIYLPAFIEEN
jgi:two-component system, cell cycle sensor histidine kinase and response regulator CckA